MQQLEHPPFDHVMEGFKNLLFWLKDESHESPEFHHYYMELQNAIAALRAWENTLEEGAPLLDKEVVLKKHLNFEVRAEYDTPIYEAMDEYAEGYRRLAKDAAYQLGKANHTILQLTEKLNQYESRPSTN